MMRFIHCSDWHPPIAHAALPQGLHLKQLLGRISWYSKRRYRYRSEVLQSAFGLWRSLSVDRFCITGDLVNFACPAEYELAAKHLRELEQSAPLSLVPGNHDALVRRGLELQSQHWGRWFARDGGEPNPWPTVVRHGCCAFVGLSSSVPTPPFFARGEVSEAQLGRLGPLLQQLGEEGLFRVVMLHHPPQPGAIAPRGALRNAAALRAVLKSAGADLVLHGHLHHPVRASLEGPNGAIPVLGAGAASSLRSGGRTDRGHFSLCAVGGSSPGGWTLTVQDYFYDQAVSGFLPSAVRTVSGPSFSNHGIET